VAWIAGSAPQADFAAEQLRQLGDFGDVDFHAVVAFAGAARPAGADAGVEHNGDVVGDEAEPRRLAIFRHQVEDRHGRRQELGVDRFLERHARDADRRFFRTLVDALRVERAELRVGALLNDLNVAKQARRQIEVEILDERRRRGKFVGFFQRLERLVQVHRRRQLERMRARGKFWRPGFVFGRHRVSAAFHPERGRCATHGQRR
jgi:hypothetical protein